MTDNVKENAHILAECVMKIIQMKYEMLNKVLTVFGYMVYEVLKAAAKVQKHDERSEFAKFCSYLMKIQDEEAKLHQQGDDSAEIVKMN